jgi:hypothetical protein
VTDQGGTGFLTSIALPGGSIGTAIPLGQTPGAGLAITPDGRTAYVSASDGVVPVDLSAGSLQSTIAPGEPSVGVAVSPVSVDATATTIECSPAEVVAFDDTTCTASVTDIGPAPTTPTGSVDIPVYTRGYIPPAHYGCSLAGDGATASCQVAVNASGQWAAGLDIVAHYPGDSTHAASDNNFSLAMDPAPTTTDVSCPPVVLRGTRITCTVTGTSPSSVGGTFQLYADNKGGVNTYRYNRFRTSVDFTFIPSETTHKITGVFSPWQQWCFCGPSQASTPIRVVDRLPT